MNHCSTEYIETNRLILRQFKVEDAKNMYEIIEGEEDTE